MKNILKKTSIRLSRLLLALVLGCSLFVSCKDDYFYDNTEPSWLGSNIYDALKEEGSFKNYIKLIDDLGQTEVLRKTGSKTIFVADDDAFSKMLSELGLTSYDQLSLAQKKLILKFGMINQACTLDQLANYNNGYDLTSLVEGGSMRRATAISIYDSIAHDMGNSIPSGKYWDKYRTSAKGITLMKDDSPSPLVYFLQPKMDKAGITDEDFKLFSGTERSSGDAHVFNSKVIKRDVRCKNGYINVLDRVLFPPTNMAEYIRQNNSTQTFSKLLERFGGPYLDKSYTSEYKRLHPEFNDSVYVKRYFASRFLGGTISYPDGNPVPSDLQLSFNPGWNAYDNSYNDNPFQSDMAAMFVPTDDAMQYYFDNTDGGKILKERYHTWDSVPNNVIMYLVKRHMRSSFIQSTASRFSNMVDENNSAFPVAAADVNNCYLGVNGAVYVTKKVYPPDSYISVYGPVLFGSNINTKIFYWIINNQNYTNYLNSLISRYSLFVPTDDAFKNTYYIDPVAYAKDKPTALKFWYGPVSATTTTSTLNATVYRYSKISSTVGDSIGVLSENDYSAFLANRLLDLLNSHIVIGDAQSGKGYYPTYGTNFIKVDGSGNNLVVKGGGDIETGTQAKVTATYNQQNGKTYLTDKFIQPSMKSIYQVLGEHTEFKAFLDLMTGFPQSGTMTNYGSVLVKKAKRSGIDFNVKFLNTYSYTLYVPTAEAINKAIKARLIKSWDDVEIDGVKYTGINRLTSIDSIKIHMKKLERFIRYHFQDNSLYIAEGNVVNGTYQTSTIRTDSSAMVTRYSTYFNKFYKIGVSGDGNGLTLTSEKPGDPSKDASITAHVITSPGVYNLMARDYVFTDLPSSLQDNTIISTTSTFYKPTISTSSSAVIHLIDNVLSFQ